MSCGSMDRFVAMCGAPYMILHSLLFRVASLALVTNCENQNEVLCGKQRCFAM